MAAVGLVWSVGGVAHFVWARRQYEGVLLTGKPKNVSQNFKSKKSKKNKKK